MFLANVLTGDESNTLLYIIVGLAIIGIIGLTLFPKLTNKDSNKDSGTGVMTNRDTDKTDDENGDGEEKK